MVGVAAALVVALSTHAPGAAVQVSLRGTFEVQCGWPGPRVAIAFPGTERLPAQIPVASVLVDGKRPMSATRDGQTVKLEIARPSGVICDAIGPGVVRVTFARSAGIHNPGRAGRYVVRARHGASSLSGAFTIS